MAGIYRHCQIVSTIPDLLRLFSIHHLELTFEVESSDDSIYEGYRESRGYSNHGDPDETFSSSEGSS